MKIVADLHALTRAAVACNQAVRELKDAPALSCLKLTTDGDRLTVLGYDRETWVRMTVAAVEVDEPGSCLVPAKDFLRWLQASPAGRVSLHATDSQVRLERGGRAFLPLLPVGEYPDPDPGVVTVRDQMPHHETAERVVESTHLADVHLPCSSLLAAVARVLFCTEKRESTKFVTRGVFFEVGDLILTLAATDTRHFAVTTLETARPSPDGGLVTAIVPREPLFKLAQVVGAESEVTVSVSDHSVVIRGDASEIGTRLLEGTFPPHRRYVEFIAEKTRDCPVIEIPTLPLLAAVRQAAAVPAASDGLAGRLELAVSGGVLTLSLPGASTVTLPLGCETPDAKTAVYAPDLLDYLQVAVSQGAKAIDVKPTTLPKVPWAMTVNRAWNYYPTTMAREATT